MKSPDLTERIEQALVMFPKARRIAVENFCGCNTSNKLHVALNLAADARSYGWNASTSNAIKWVLEL